MPARSPGERALVSTVAAHDSWARTPDRSARTAPARTAFDRRFLDQVDPDRVLSEDERNRRAASARKAYFARLTLKSIQARRAKSGRPALPPTPDTATQALPVGDPVDGMDPSCGAA